MNKIYMTVSVDQQRANNLIKTTLSHADEVIHMDVRSQQKAIHSLKQILATNSNAVIVIESNFLKRAQRRQFYSVVRERAEVHILFIYTPLSEMPERRDDYIRQQVPRIGTDCDVMTVVSETRVFDTPNVSGFLTAQEIVAHTLPDLRDEIVRIFTPHDTPYHLESVDEHITQTMVLSDIGAVHDVAVYHDLGKGVAKMYLDDNRAVYSGHESLSAVYALIDRHAGETLTQNDLIVEAVHQHMHALRGGRELDNLTSTELSLIEAFAEIDKKARRTHDITTRHHSTN